MSNHTSTQWSKVVVGRSMTRQMKWNDFVDNMDTPSKNEEGTSNREEQLVVSREVEEEGRLEFLEEDKTRHGEVTNFNQTDGDDSNGDECEEGGFDGPYLRDHYVVPIQPSLFLTLIAPLGQK